MSSGLVLIQIDGFSKKELERALEAGEMPCLKRILSKEHYRLYPHYPGLPSSTPSVQGELFYGVPHCVPAFFFYDKVLQEPVQMSSGAEVQRIEEELAGRGEGLLQGGSSYANIFSGGAQGCHFCACSLGWNKVWKDINVINFVRLFMTHFVSFVRMTWLTVLEVVLAAWDFVRGMLCGENLKTEAMFIPVRASVCVLLRELITIGALMDMAGGLPVIHLNFLGYDELAHRRGPASKAAHWSLRGIDRCIGKIYTSALRSHRRHYDVWVYSDHGQQDMELYPMKYGRSIHEAIGEVYGEKSSYRDNDGRGHRVRYLGGIFQRLFSHEEKETASRDLVVVAKGGIGHVYVNKTMGPQERQAFADGMVSLAHVPMVAAKEGRGQARVWTPAGQYILPQQAKEVLGRRHPYLARVTADLISLCHHPQAGDFFICGLGPDGSYVNFALEHGDHGGPGIDETDAFAILPAGLGILPDGRDHLLTADVRQAALGLLKGRPQTVRPPKPHKDTIRLMTYNVHSCVGLDGRISAERVARLISRYEPDIIALQELDLSRPKTGGEDQPHTIAKYLQMLYHFHPCIQIEEEKYGTAILSRFPMQIKKAAMLPALSKYLEPRGALWARIEVAGRNLQVISTHLSLFHLEGLMQMEALLGKDWLLHPECRGPVVLCGDFNAAPLSAVYRKAKKVLRDAQRELDNHSPQATWFSHYPFGRIDHVFVSPDIKVAAVQVPQGEAYKMVSDHLPLIVDLQWEAIHATL